MSACYSALSGEEHETLPAQQPLCRARRCGAFRPRSVCRSDGDTIGWLISRSDGNVVFALPNPLARGWTRTCLIPHVYQTRSDEKLVVSSRRPHMLDPRHFGLPYWGLQQTCRDSLCALTRFLTDQQHFRQNAGRNPYLVWLQSVIAVFDLLPRRLPSVSSGRRHLDTGSASDKIRGGAERRPSGPIVPVWIVPADSQRDHT
jgi:hypothetical protein